MNTNITIDATSATPLVLFDGEAGLLKLEGESYPENSFAFYDPVLAAVRQFLDQGREPFEFEVALVYLNTSSIKCVMDILDLMEAAHRAGKTVAVRWRYDPDNDRALEMAEEFKEDISLPFHLIGERPVRI